MARFGPALPVALAALLMLSGLSRTDLLGPDETRYAQAAREMLETGDYVHLQVNGRPYAKKPPLLMWLTVAASRVTGELGPFEARLPSALAGVGSVVLVALLGGVLLSRGAARFGALFLAATPIFVGEARTGRMDVLLTFLVLASFLGFVLWERRRGPGFLAFALFFLPLPLGILTKWTGPLFVLPPAILYLLLTGQLRRIPPLATALGLLITLAPLLFWVDLSEFGRILGGSAHSRPFHYHLVRLPLVTLPFFLLLPGAVILSRRGTLAATERRGLLLLFTWILFALAMLSLSGGKRSNYLDPVFPAVALVAGWFAARTAAGGPTALRRLAFRAPLAAVGGLVLLSGAALALRPSLPNDWLAAPGTWRAVGTLAAIGGLVVILAALRAKPGIAAAAVVVVTAAGCLVSAFVLEPARNPAVSLRPFMEVYRGRAAPDARIAYLGGSDGASRWPSPELLFHTARGTRIPKLKDVTAALEWLQGEGERHLIVKPPWLDTLLREHGFALPPGVRIEAENRYRKKEYVLLSNRRGSEEPVLLGP